MIRSVFSRKSIYWLMIALTGGALVFSGLPGMVKALMSTSNSVGSVNGMPILLYEYRAELAKEHRLLALYRDQFGPNYHKILTYLGKSENVEQSAQEQLITNKLLLAMAHAIPVYLHPAYITRELAQPRIIYGILGEAIPAHYIFTEQGILKLDMLQRFLKSQGLTMEQFEGLAESLLTSQWGLKLAYGSVIVSKSSQELFNRLNFHDRTFKLETVDLSPLLKDLHRNPLTDQEVAEFYEKNRSSSAYWSPERRSGTVWSFELSRFSPAEEGEGQKKGKEDADANRTHFTQSAQQLVFLGDEKALQQFIESYHAQKSTVVKMLKPDAQAKDADPLITSLFSVGGVGDRAVTTKGSRGYIVEVTETVAPQKLDFEVVREKVVEDLYRSRAQSQGMELLKDGKDARYKTQSFTLSAGTRTLPELLTKHDMPLGVLDGLLMPGHSQEGTNNTAAYRVTLMASELNEKKRDEGLHDGGRMKKLYEENGDLVLRNLIASLRSHAIILIRTESEIYN